VQAEDDVKGEKENKHIRYLSIDYIVWYNLLFCYFRTPYPLLTQHNERDMNQKGYGRK
jgi:hypothetical protein